MRFLPTKFDTAWLLESVRHEDERGFFARTWCQREFEKRGLNSDLVQCSASFSKVTGTLRGMHFQSAPHEEAKLVRCTRGRIFDVIVDIRDDSTTFGLWQSFELSEQNGHALYIPEGFAHGFQTLAPNSEVFYQMSEYFSAEASCAFHHADVQLAINWPLPVSNISDRDAQLPPLALIDAVADPLRRAV